MFQILAACKMDLESASRMSGRPLKLGRPDAAAGIDERDAQEPDGWRKRRRLAVKLAAKGE